MLALAQRGQRLETGNRQQPGGNLGTAFELAGGAPHVQKHLADEVFGQGGVAHHTQHEAVNPDVMTGIKHMHRRAAALGDTPEQHLIGCRAGRRDIFAGCSVDGDDVRHDRLPVRRWRRFVGRIDS